MLFSFDFLSLTIEIKLLLLYLKHLKLLMKRNNYNFYACVNENWITIIILNVLSLLYVAFVCDAIVANFYTFYYRYFLSVKISLLNRENLGLNKPKFSFQK